MKGIQTTSARTPEWLDKATRLKEVALQRLESMPEALSGMSPAPDAWSAAGVVEHLILLEENIVGLWREKLLETTSPRAGIKPGIVSRLVGFLITKTGIRVPTAPELEPKDAQSADVLRRRWHAARENLIAALPDDPKSAWIMHPAFGPLSSEQMGRILAAHLEHHLRHWPAPKA